MAFHFDESNDDVQLADHAALTLKAADANSWSFGGWLKLDDNTGSLFQYFFSWGIATAQSSANVWIFEDSHASAGKMSLYISESEGGGSNVFFTTANAMWTGNTSWTHVLVVCDQTNITLYVNGVNEGSGSVVSMSTDTHPTAPHENLFLGARQDLNVDRYFGGDMADWFKVDRELNAGEIAALVAGVSSQLVAPDAAWRVPMIRDYIETQEGITVSNTGSTTAPHPPLYFPASRRVEYPASGPTAAVTGTTEPAALEAEIVSGGETIIITLTGDTWVAA